MGYIYSWTGDRAAAAIAQVTWPLPVHNQRRNMSEASEELKRIAAALEEILRLVKADQEKMEKRLREEN